MSNATTIIDQFANRGRFLAVLVAAELNATTAWECSFTNDLRDRFERFDCRMQLSSVQRQQLWRIAGE